MSAYVSGWTCPHCLRRNEPADTTCHHCGVEIPEVTGE